MRLVTLLQTLLLGIATVQATDDRLLYTIPENEIIDKFRTCFEKTCSAWKPAQKEGLTFRGYIFEPGNYEGMKMDTEARIVCSWYNATGANPNTPSVTFTQQVAAYLGATRAAD
ncbi:hypothetical protein DFH07DRAFT_945214 [Mycena maculata]|uniref:Uncharacterized protein n=1 Tax=Mycena maculata TaxID=230809 RepID=A0AAD7HYL7_9AGAR|nr:hypothetical protein DFH07DRAFT_945214 [Mycena maculata]